jgi:hypothetical protein
MPNPKPNIICTNHFNFHTKSTKSKKLMDGKNSKPNQDGGENHVIESPIQESTKSNIIIVQTHCNNIKAKK